MWPSRKNHQYRDEFRLVASEAADRLGLKVLDEHRIGGDLNGADVEIFVEAVGSEMGGSQIRTAFVVGLPGWPLETATLVRPIRDRVTHGGLPLPKGWPKWRQWPLLRRRYVLLGASEWDNAFIVQSDDPDTTRLQLDRRRRTAIVQQCSRVRQRCSERANPQRDGFQTHCNLERGRLVSAYLVEVPGPSRIEQITTEMGVLADVLAN